MTYEDTKPARIVNLDSISSEAALQVADLIDSRVSRSFPGTVEWHKYHVAKILRSLVIERDKLQRRAELAEGYAQPYHDEATKLRRELSDVVAEHDALLRLLKVLHRGPQVGNADYDFAMLDTGRILRTSQEPAE